MAIGISYNVPTSTENDVDLVTFDRTKLTYQYTSDETSKAGARTFKSYYLVEAGDPSVRTMLTVRATANPPASSEPYGKVSYAISIETVGVLSDGGEELHRSPATFTLSWNVPGQTLYDASQMHDTLQALTSLMWSAVAAGVPQDGNMTKLSFANTRLFG